MKGSGLTLAATAVTACCIVVRLQVAAGFASFPMRHGHAELLARHRVCPAARLGMVGQPARSQSRRGRGGAGRPSGGRGGDESVRATGAARGGRTRGLQAGRKRGAGGAEETIVCMSDIMYIVLIKNAFVLDRECKSKKPILDHRLELCKLRS